MTIKVIVKQNIKDMTVYTAFHYVILIGFDLRCWFPKVWCAVYIYVIKYLHIMQQVFAENQLKRWPTLADNHDSILPSFHLPCIQVNWATIMGRE